jgi:tetratricopeptide (TPR) repeat protein
MSALALALVAAAAAADLHPLVAEAEQAWSDDEMDRSIALLDQRLAEDPDDIEAAWRKARSLYSKGERMAEAGAPVAQRIAMYEEMERTVAGPLAKNPNHGALLHWKGTAMGRKATAKGVLSSLFMADDIEGAWLAASKSDYRYRSADDTSSMPGDVYFALGQFYRLCPDWTLVKMLVGTKGDIDESIEWLRKGVKFSPTRPEMAKELGVSLLCKAEKQDDAAALAEGKKWLNKAAAMPSQKSTDDIDKKQIPIILSKVDDACGYSRDGWQDLSKDAYDKANK